MKFACAFFVTVVGVCSAAYIGLPTEDEALFEHEPVSLTRVRRQVLGSYPSNDGRVLTSVIGTGKQPIYSDSKTMVTGSLTGMKFEPNRDQPKFNLPPASFPASYAGTAQLDLQRTLCTTAAKRADDAMRDLRRGESALLATGYGRRDVAPGMSPRDSFGAGLEARHAISDGLQVYANGMRQWNNPDKNQFGIGIRGTF